MNDFKLDSRPGIKSGFKAPDSYFESLTERVMLNLPSEEVKVIPLYRRKPVWITSAAAALVLSLTLVLSKNETSAPVLTSEVINADYLLNNAGVSTEDILSNISAEDLKELNQESINGLSNQMIEDNADFDVIY